MPAGDTEKEVRESKNPNGPFVAVSRNGELLPELGAWIEFDFRNTLEGGRTDAIRQVGPELCFLSEFWTKLDGPREYAGAAGVSAFAEAMRARGFSNRELEMMFKENPAKALGLAVTPENRI